jgi:hypothetical protein
MNFQKSWDIDYHFSKKIFFYEKNCVVPGKYVLIIIFRINCVFG